MLGPPSLRSRPGHTRALRSVKGNQNLMSTSGNIPYDYYWLKARASGQAVQVSWPAFLPYFTG
jgi:hypothetical protein